VLEAEGLEVMQERMLSERAPKECFAGKARSLLRVDSRFLTVGLVFGMYACGTWHGPGGGGGCKLEGTDDDTSSEGGSSNTDTDAQTSTTDAGPDAAPDAATTGKDAGVDAGTSSPGVDSGVAAAAP